MSSQSVLGIGGPIMDSLLRVSEEFITTLPGRRHGMQPIDYPTMLQIIQDSKQIPQVVAGGSAANTIKALAALGHSASLAGAIGRDALGQEFLHQMAETSVSPLLKSSDTPTGQVLCLITPDGHRTCRTYLGASQEYTGEDLDPTHFRGNQLVHIESYSFQNRDLTIRAAKLAKESGAKVSLDLSSHEIVAAHRTVLPDLLRSAVDIVVGNEDEVAALFFSTTPEESCRLLAQWCEIAIVLQGKQGCLVGTKDGVAHYPAYVVEPLDTTGAGDLFIAGFLHGYLERLPLATCAHFGALLGNAAVQVMGSNLPKETWKSLIKEIQK